MSLEGISGPVAVKREKDSIANSDIASNLGIFNSLPWEEPLVLDCFWELAGRWFTPVRSVSCSVIASLVSPYLPW